MKRNLFVFVIFLALGLMLMGQQSAQAGTAAIASINQVGQHEGNSIVILTHFDRKPVFIKQGFRLNPKNQREMLAIALTAASMGKNIVIQINNDGYNIDRIRILIQ
jgi:hypothetical protein